MSNRYVVAAATAAFAILVSVSATAPVVALGSERCLDEVMVRGPSAPSHSSAIAAAIRAWQPVAGRRYGRQFADYWYSGDRQITCEWNNPGTRYRCTVNARPCGPKG